MIFHWNVRETCPVVGQRPGLTDKTDSSQPDKVHIECVQTERQTDSPQKGNIGKYTKYRELYIDIAVLSAFIG